MERPDGPGGRPRGGSKRGWFEATLAITSMAPADRDPRLSFPQSPHLRDLAHFLEESTMRYRIRTLLGACTLTLAACAAPGTEQAAESAAVSAAAAPNVAADLLVDASQVEIFDGAAPVKEKTPAELVHAERNRADAMAAFMTEMLKGVSQENRRKGGDGNVFGAVI